MAFPVLGTGADKSSEFSIPFAMKKKKVSDYKAELFSAFCAVETPGDFAVGGEIDASPFPALQVEGIGAMGFPLSESHAKALINVCSLAPFGMKEQTIVDTKIRNTWQLEPSKFKMLNPKWETVLLNSLLSRVKTGLGVSTIQCKLYKLLLYETGGFFLPHRDTEKEDRMFATLTIQLPSEYEGGELIVRHKGHEHTFDFAKDSLFTYHFSAFYADCQHEVRPVSIFCTERERSSDKL